MNGKSIYFTGLLSLLLLTALCLPANGKVIYVDDDATGTNNGSSWQNAYKYLQDALTNAKNAQKPVEIRIAQGIYKPDRGTGITPGNRNATFQLISDVNIIGGYAGLNQPDPNVRDFELYSTILSGDLNDNDVDVNDIDYLLDEPTRTENCYHVVTGSNTSSKAILDGFIITAGNANSTTSQYQEGAGMYNYAGSPTLKNCIFKLNSAHYGGGMSNYYNNLPLIKCTFIENAAIHHGGGIDNYDSNIKLTNCTFRWNISGDKGGGIRNVASNPILNNCTFSRNAGRLGGGIYNDQKSSSTITNCTFVENSANENGSVLYNNETSGKSMLINCILWNNNPAQIYGSGVSVTYSDIQGGWSGKGNIDVNPLFANPNKGDYHLQSKAGRWNPNSQSWIKDAITSPCIDAGDPNSPIGYELNSVRINMGAYGGTLEASTSLASNGNYFQKSSAPNPANGAVDISNTMLSWISDTKAVFHEVYIGTSKQPPFVQKCCQTNFKPGILEPNTQYYWRIDNVDKLLNRVIGNIWTFTTGDYPVQASNPSPADGSAGVSINATLSWEVGLNAISHNVYFGTNFNDVNIATVANSMGILVSSGKDSNSYKPRTLNYNRKYYWRVDEIDSKGSTTTGNIWAFTTQQGGGGGGGGAGKGPFCFIGSTPVWIRGKAVPISIASVGQSTGGIGTIEQVQEHEGTFTVYDVLLDGGNCITVAENHYFMTEAGDWSSLHDLKAGMRLKTSKGSVGITSITKQPTLYTGRVYNLKIQGSDLYMVGDDAVIVRDY